MAKSSKKTYPILNKVVYEAFEQPPETLQAQKNRAKNNLDLILASADALLGSVPSPKRKLIKMYLKKLVPLITPLDNGSGLFLYNSDSSTSLSPLHILLKYFLFADLENRPLQQPPDAQKFLSVLKKANFPASLLSMIHI